MLTINDECGVCLEPLIRHIKSPVQLPCRHVIHRECMEKILGAHQIGCPFCKKTMIPLDWENMQRYYDFFEPHSSDRMIDILCNDCLKHSTVPDHPFMHPCLLCKSMNTTHI
jgi:RING finger/CHY zinc finger protein 1